MCIMFTFNLFFDIITICTCVYLSKKERSTNMTDKLLLEGKIVSSAKDLTFPNLTEYIESLHSLKEIEDTYVPALRKEGTIYHRFYANKLIEYQQTVRNFDNLFLLESNFLKLKRHLFELKETEEITLPISLTKRRKNFVALNEKIRLTLLKALDNPYDKTASLSQILDTLGFRIVIGNQNNGARDEQNSVDTCYLILNTVIMFFIDLGYTPVELNFNKEDFNHAEYPDIVLPGNTAIILPGFELYVKDYIKYPKKNGYQSLHVVFKTDTGLFFEIQIRTQSMHYRAEFGKANHDNYNEEKYKNVKISFDPLKTNIMGYKVILNSDKKLIIMDQIGLTSSDIADPFNVIF